MEKIAYQALLYDFYKELLTEHQQSVYEDYCYHDLSLSEIAEQKNISRQGVYDLIKRCNKILEDYENKLHLIEKFDRTKKSVLEINKYANEILTCYDQNKIQMNIENIERMTNQILEDL